MAQLEDVARLQARHRVLVAVDAHAIGALVVDHLPVPLVEHETGVCSRDGLVVGDDVVLVRASELHLRAHEVELFAAERPRESHQPRHLGSLEVARFYLGTCLGKVRHADDGGRASGRRIGRHRGRRDRRLYGRSRLLRRERGLCRSKCARHGLRRQGGGTGRLESAGRNRRRTRGAGRGRHHGRVELPLDAQIVVADLDQVPFLDPRPSGDLLAVDADAVVRAQILDQDVPVLLEKPCVAARDVPLGQANGVPILPSDGDLVAYQWDDGLSTLVVLDDQLHHAPWTRRGPAASAPSCSS